MSAPPETDQFLFGAFRLDRRVGGLFRHDRGGDTTPVALGGRALDVLSILITHHGDLVSKQDIMRAVWPGIVVDEKNLAVQISTLRRILDETPAERSCIQTEIGRGYRFVAPVTRQPAEEAEQVRPRDEENPPAPPRSATRWLTPARAGLIAAMALVLVLGSTGTAWFLISGPVFLAADATADPAQSAASGARPQAATEVEPVQAPRLSVAVLPLQNLGGDSADSTLADAITDDLTTDLAHFTGMTVISRELASLHKGKIIDVRRIGSELGVRYVVSGSVRRMDMILQVNVQVTATETGALLWSDRFDEPVSPLAATLQQVVARLYDTIGANLLGIEAARSQRERPANPDAFDLVLQARAISRLPSTVQRESEIAALFERALLLDPSSVPAALGIAFYLTDGAWPSGWRSVEDMQRSGALLASVRAREPDTPAFLNVWLLWLRMLGRCAEVIETAEHALQLDPNRLRSFTGVYTELATCKMRTGHSEEALKLQVQLDQLNPRSPWKFNRYRHMGVAALMLGRDQEAIGYFQRSAAMHPGSLVFAGHIQKMLAAALVRTGQLDEARTYRIEAERLRPYDTIRALYPEELSSSVYVEQIRNLQAALRLAGARDHADEDADFGVPADTSLHSLLVGPTPMEAPGARTIRTPTLVRLLAEEAPLMIDTMQHWWGRSVAGAVGLRFSGLGGSVTDTTQDRLRTKMLALTGGDRGMRIVAIGYNSERFDGYNLALRLVALGYTNVDWYRGGREAWEVADHPETAARIETW